MKKLLVSLSLILALLLCLTSCTGYNNIMYDHLSDASNYKQYDATLVGFRYEYEEYEYSDEYDSEKMEDAFASYLLVSFDSKAEVAAFLGVSTDGVANELSEYTFYLEINSANNKILLENGFYDAVEEGCQIKVTTSNWIYMDGNFFFVSGVSYDGVEYLNAKVGLQNIRAMMRENRSMF